MTAYGSDFGVRSPTWISRFTDMARQADFYRNGRVLLAGDAAHVHYPTGGQGLNTGVQDAVNLGWKLAQVVKGTSPESLLDTYHAERYPVAAAVLRNTMAQVALLRTDDRTGALRDITSEIFAMAEPRKRLAAMITGLDIRYDFGDGHPLLGRRMPDVDLITCDGTLRAFALLHEAKGALVNFGGPGRFDITPWADRVRLVDASILARWELPVIGTVAAPAAVLIRPDGHVAWVSDGTGRSLADTLTNWFGAPASSGPAGEDNEAATTIERNSRNAREPPQSLPSTSCFPQPLPPRIRRSNWPTMVQSGPHRHRRGPVKEVMTPEERPPGPGGPPFKSWSTMLNVATSNLESRGGELGGETELKASGLDPCCWKVRVTTNSPSRVRNTS